MRGADGPEVQSDVPDRLPPRASNGGRTPATPPAAPYAAAELDRFKLTEPVTLDDMAELRRRVLEHGGGSVEVYRNVGAAVVVDVRWPNGSHVRREIVPVTSQP